MFQCHRTSLFVDATVAVVAAGKFCWLTDRRVPDLASAEL
jgi:hypothetical protein